MTDALETLAGTVLACCGESLVRVPSRCRELTFEVPSAQLLSVCRTLRDEPGLRFEQLVDVAGVDYLTYGCDEWNTSSATSSGFSRSRSTLTPPSRAPSPMKWERVKREREAKRERARSAASPSCTTCCP